MVEGVRFDDMNPISCLFRKSQDFQQYLRRGLWPTWREACLNWQDWLHSQTCSYSAIHCIALYWMHCTVLNALYCTELNCIVLHCTSLHCTAGFTWRWKVLGSHNLLTAAAQTWRGNTNVSQHFWILISIRLNPMAGGVGSVIPSQLQGSLKLICFINELMATVQEKIHFLCCLLANWEPGTTNFMFKM